MRVSKASFCSAFIVATMLSLLSRASSSLTTSVWRSSWKHSRHVYETHVEGFRVLVKGGLVDCRQAKGGQVETVELQDGVDVVEGPCSSSLLTASTIPHLFLEQGKEECLKSDFAERHFTGSLTDPKTRMSTNVRRSCFGISNDAASRIRCSHSRSWFIRPRA